LGIDLGDIFTGNEDFFGDGADGERDIEASFLSDFEDDAFGFEFLEAFRGDDHVVSARRQRGGDVDSVGVGLRGARQVAPYVGDDDFRADDGGAGLVGNCAADEGVGLGASEGGEKQQGQESEFGKKGWAARQL